MIEITKDNVLEYLKAAVDTQGEDFVYNQDGAKKCSYLPVTPVEDDNQEDPRTKTGCLIGVMLRQLGISDDVLAHSGNVTASSLLSDLSDRGIMRHDDVSRLALAKAQRCQDEGDTWGQAYRTAQNYIQNVD